MMSFVKRAVKACEEKGPKGWLDEHFKRTKELADKISRENIIENAEKPCLAAAYRMLANSFESILDEDEKALYNFMVSHINVTTAEVHIPPFMKGGDGE